MGIFGRGAPEDRTLAEAAALRTTAEAGRIGGVASADQQRREFLLSPQGQARTAYEHGDDLFQVDFPIMKQSYTGPVMAGAFDPSQSNPATRMLNLIAGEGWDLISSSVVFVIHGEESKDKFMGNGQTVTVHGETRGFYVFKRDEGRVAR